MLHIVIYSMLRQHMSYNYITCPITVRQKNKTTSNVKDSQPPAYCTSDIATVYRVV